MSKSQQTPTIPLPKGWKKQVRSAVLHVLSLAQYAAIYSRGWAADSTNARVRLKAELDRANQELLLLREEIRIKDARLARIDPHRRPHYPPTERMAILTLRVTRGWSLEQAARVFHVTAATIACWMRRVDEQGPKTFFASACPAFRPNGCARSGVSMPSRRTLTWVLPTSIVRVSPSAILTTLPVSVLVGGEAAVRMMATRRATYDPACGRMWDLNDATRYNATDVEALASDLSLETVVTRCLVHLPVLPSSVRHRSAVASAR